MTAIHQAAAYHKQGMLNPRFPGRRNRGRSDKAGGICPDWPRVEGMQTMCQTILGTDRKRQIHGLLGNLPVRMKIASEKGKLGVYNGGVRDPDGNPLLVA